MAKIGTGFTIPGEAGCEALTLALAQKWGADCVRDSDGTLLSPEILSSGMAVYSTLCLVRSVNDWAQENMDKLQRTFLMSRPVLAEDELTRIQPLEDFFTEQFVIAPNDDPTEFWQVFDRTLQAELTDWTWDGKWVTINHTVPGHLYTVNFLATRVWEEISMYNHITNQWGDKAHLMAVEPRYPETQKVLLDALVRWCDAHPDTQIVRFTSLFYNFCWMWS
ncbi:MAG: 1,3-beta-galactosyl-N-acetylhexosamine phosphorylase N-terminal domain-containing protein, partial [Clostridia bacterium]